MKHILSQLDISNDYGHLCRYLVWFHSETPVHYYGMQPDEIVVSEYVKIEEERLLDALKDAKRLLKLPEFPSDAIVNTINLRFDNYEEDVYPWFLSILKLLEEEADKQNIVIPNELRGIWKRE